MVIRHERYLRRVDNHFNRELYSNVLLNNQRLSTHATQKLC